MMAAPCRNRDLWDPAFVSKRNPEPIRVSTAVKFIPGNQSDGNATSAVTKACCASCFPHKLMMCCGKLNHDCASAITVCSPGWMDVLKIHFHPIRHSCHSYRATMSDV